MYSFPNFKSVYCSMSGSNCCFLTCIQVSQEASKMVWYSHLLNNFPQFAVIHTVKSFSIVNEADVLLEFSCFFYDPTDVVNLISASSAFSKTSLKVHGSHTLEGWLGEFWALLCYHVRWLELCGSLSILWHCPSLGLKRKLTFSRPVTTAEFSRFADR